MERRRFDKCFDKILNRIMMSGNSTGNNEIKYVNSIIFILYSSRSAIDLIKGLQQPTTSLTGGIFRTHAFS